jgi:hypothetical protein
MIFGQFGSFPGCELRKNNSGADTRRLEQLGVRAVRSQISDLPRDPGPVRLRSLRNDGLRPANVPREPERHRGLPQRAAAAALSCRDSRHGEALQSGVCERASRLAAVCRSGGRVDAPGAPTLRGRTRPGGPGRRLVRVGRDADRAEPGAFPVGALGGHAGRREAQRAARPAGRPSGVCQPVRGRPARGRLPQRDSRVSRSLLRDESGRPRLHAAAPAAGGGGVLCHPDQDDHKLQRRRAAARRRGGDLRCDQHIRLNSKRRRQGYPEDLRCISYIDPETKKRLVFLTNQFALDALTVALINKHRWKIELFFRWIKQHPRLRGIFSTDPNGVRVQTRTARCAYLLVAIAQRENA